MKAGATAAVSLPGSHGFSVAGGVRGDSWGLTSSESHGGDHLV